MGHAFYSGEVQAAVLLLLLACQATGKLSWDWVEVGGY